MRVDCDVRKCQEYIEIPDDEVDEAGGIKTPNGYKAMLDYMDDKGWTIKKYPTDNAIFFYCPKEFQDGS